MYENSRDVTKDNRQAREWYEKAATAGSREAKVDLQRARESVGQKAKSNKRR
jgi:TPR repeat protein